MSPSGGGADGGDARAVAGRVSSSSFWGDITGVFAVVFLTYVLGAVLAWASFGSDLGPAFFFPAAGVTVSAMLLSRRAIWPAIVAAILTGEVMVDTFYGNDLWEAAGFGVANTIEALVGASLVLRWVGGRPDLRKRRDFSLFIAGACLIGPLVGGVIGGTFGALHDGKPWLNAMLNWWAGDALGVLVLGAPILLWATQSYIFRERPWETVGVLLVTVGLSVAAFWSEAPPSLLILPVLAWAALRLDMLGAAMAGAVAAFLANMMTTRGRGMFAGMDVAQGTRVALTQVFVATVVVVAMLIAQEAAARMSAVRERETERRERLRMESLAGLAQRLSAALTPHDIGQTLTVHLLNEAGASSLNLGLVSQDGNYLNWVAMAGYPRSVIDAFAGGVALSERTVATDSTRTGEPVIIRTAAEYAASYPEAVKWSSLSRSQSVVGWPLHSGGAPIGVLLLGWGARQQLNVAQLAYISAVATMVSQALVRAKIYTDEHARAAVLHAAVLPGPVDTARLDVCVTYEPADVAQGLGGDWYDIMPLPENRTYFAVGDVVGHGLPAVEDMAQLRTAGRAFAHQGLPPAQLLAELNGFTRHASQGKFATMAVAVFDPGKGMLTYCVAGHPPPFLRRAATGRVVQLGDARGPVLGPMHEVTYREGEVPVSAGDILVMYTDGLVERHGMDLETGMARAERIIAGWDTGDLADYCGVLQDNLAPRPRADDVCILVVRFKD
jgi:integral membrane sensor domain MASE1